MKKNFTLGLDLGTNSIGWAIIRNNKFNEPQSIINCGSRIFQEAVDAKTRTPKNQTRREARSARKTIARRKMRRLNLLNILVNNNLLPANRLEKLSGNRKGQHSIRINDKWRICFIWQSQDVHEVEITDYH